jgi:uncharacterized Tic20 family protein
MYKVLLAFGNSHPVNYADLYNSLIAILTMPPSESSQFNNKEKIVESETSEVVPQDSKNIALLIWIGSIFFGFIPGLIVYLIKKDDPYIQDQAKEALNWSITASIGYFAGYILSFVLIGMFVLPVVGICNLVFCIMGAIGASNGKPFRVPFAIRLIK